jgi:prevent-host-death family protein
MTRVTATEARRSLFDLLDAVERGEEIAIERRGVRFRVVLEDEPRRAAVASPFASVARDVADGQWSWEADRAGRLRFRKSR